MKHLREEQFTILMKLGVIKDNVSWSWYDSTVVSYKDAFNKGLSIGLRNLNGLGERLIILDIGNEDGFVKEAGRIFHAKTEEERLPPGNGCFLFWSMIYWGNKQIAKVT